MPSTYHFIFSYTKAGARAECQIGEDRTHTFNFFFGRFISAYVHAGMHCHSAYVCGSWRTLSGVGSLILLSVLVLIVYSRLSLGPCTSRQFSVSASQFVRGAQRLQMCAITSF